jgi:hypothetical protein
MLSCDFLTFKNMLKRASLIRFHITRQLLDVIL